MSETAHPDSLTFPQSTNLQEILPRMVDSFDLELSGVSGSMAAPQVEGAQCVSPVGGLHSAGDKNGGRSWFRTDR